MAVSAQVICSYNCAVTIGRTIRVQGPLEVRMLGMRQATFKVGIPSFWLEFDEHYCLAAHGGLLLTCCTSEKVSPSSVISQ
jgi:hypothetical protein